MTRAQGWEFLDAEYDPGDDPYFDQDDDDAQEDDDATDPA